ncbi:MAG TPA: ester cyclase [Amaricoccus sp.]|nr:ester cyclase [Amaricoccus sp.]
MASSDSEVPAANKARQLGFVEILQNRGKLDRVPEFVREDAVDHSLPPGMPGGAAGVAAVLGAIRAGFPDHDAKVIHMVAEGDLVATYKTFTGTNSGDFFGMPPTGRRATIRVMDFVRYEDGRIAEHWNIVDMAGLMQQLGDGPSRPPNRVSGGGFLR